MKMRCTNSQAIPTGALRDDIQHHVERSQQQPGEGIGSIGIDDAPRAQQGVPADKRAERVADSRGAQRVASGVVAELMGRSAPRACGPAPP